MLINHNVVDNVDNVFGKIVITEGVIREVVRRNMYG